MGLQRVRYDLATKQQQQYIPETPIIINAMSLPKSFHLPPLYTEEFFFPFVVRALNIRSALLAFNTKLFIMSPILYSSSPETILQSGNYVSFDQHFPICPFPALLPGNHHSTLHFYVFDYFRVLI